MGRACSTNGRDKKKNFVICLQTGTEKPNLET